jgi:hypothetical protein
MVPLAVQVIVAPVASVTTLSLVRSGSRLTDGCSSRMKVLSFAAAVTATTERSAAAATVSIADPVAVARTTA